MNTEKAETLREIIEFCSKANAEFYETKFDGNPCGVYEEQLICDGAGKAYASVIEHCKTMLGYGGTILLLKDENQAKDAK